MHEEERKVVVTGLTQNATEPMLREAFRKCGYIEDVVVARESGGTSRGFAFVVFGLVDIYIYINTCFFKTQPTN
ncbi:unnamed protein product [Polarella glacialis]|uniref:RRM domain-containing protein n=1 Tax=Polarella glacialis TaxID=89957 RepID=A0A813FDZ0_POLGL|nr:unnamed protein product [Polarella glacialis]